MKKNEQSFISKELIPWMRHNLPFSFAWEAKHVTTKEKHYNYKSDRSLKKEITNLKIAGRKLIYKIPDGVSLSGTPFDGFCLHQSSGIFFFKFEEHKDRFFYIQVETLEKEINGLCKSLTAERTAEIGITVMLGKKKMAL